MRFVVSYPFRKEREMDGARSICDTRSLCSASGEEFTTDGAEYELKAKSWKLEAVFRGLSA
jgi:hypothetical protein